MRLLIAYFIFLLFSCTPNKLGKLTLGENGKVISGTKKLRCSHPQKRYARNLELKVKGSIDSTLLVPRSNLETTINKTVTRLADNTSEGLDIDLILFRICELANNLGLNEAETNTLLKTALEAWNRTKYPGITVTNYGINNGIIAGTVILPEDKTEMIEDNFEVITTTLKYKNSEESVIKFNPKVGEWSYFYAAIAKKEVPLVKPSLLTPLFFSDTIYVKENKTKDLELFILKSNHNGSCSKQNPYYLKYQNLPSEIWFGDLSNPKKNYKVSLTKL